MSYVGYSYEQVRTLFIPVMVDILLTCSVINHFKKIPHSPLLVCLCDFFCFVRIVYIASVGTALTCSSVLLPLHNSRYKAPCCAIVFCGMRYEISHIFSYLETLETL